jgi:hypothetical protein
MPAPYSHSLVWHDFGLSHTAGHTTSQPQRAKVTEYEHIEGFTHFRERMSNAGFVLSAHATVAAFHRTLLTDLSAYPYQTQATSYSFFASLRFMKKLPDSTLVLHRAARSKRGESFEQAASSLVLDQSSSASLTWLASNEPYIGPSRTQLRALSFVVRGAASAISNEYGIIEIPYRTKPSKRYPSGRDALFKVSVEHHS